MIYSINKSTTKQKVIQKFLLTLSLAVFLMTSFALPPQPALAGNLFSKSHNRVHPEEQPRTTARERRINDRARRANNEMMQRESEQQRNAPSRSSSISSSGSRH